MKIPSIKNILKNKPKWKIIIPLVLIFTIIISYFILLEKPQTAEADWWDDSWLYRQTVAITNSGTNQTDFQTMITLDSATLITASKVQSDCDDIRLTDINGKLIPHWIEPSTCNTSATKIWTKVPSITTNGATLYLYYGNSAINSTSSVADTFIREISGVQGAWDMDEGIWTNDCSTNTALDSSGNPNHGKSCPNADGTQPSIGKFGNGGVFDGSNDYVDVGSDSSLDITDEITIEAWVKPTSVSVDRAGIVIYGDNRARMWYSTTQYVSVEWRDDALSYLSTTAVNIGAGSWKHVVGVYDKSNSVVDLYVNGIQATQKSNNGNSLVSSNNLVEIGRDNFANRNFNGSIDNVRIYNTALTATEISDLYGTGGDRQGYVTSNYPNKSLVRKYSASVSVGSPASEERGPGPVAYWKFDEGFGQTANDSTINANSGTLGATSGSESSDPTWQTEDMCISGKCLKFDGVDDYVNMGNDSSLDITTTTVSMWFNAKVSGDSLMGRDFDEWRFYGNPVNIYNNRDGAYSNWSTNWSYSINTWYNIVWVNSGTNEYLYINGELKNSRAVSGVLTSNKNLIIGEYSVGNDPFNGFIDDVKIYPYARTATQIKADYASRGTASGVSVAIGDDGKKSLSDGLVGYWKMDESSWDGTADEVVDASGAGNDGIAVGAGGIPTTGAGKFGNGGSFDGVDDYVDIPDSMYGISNAYTVGAWIKPNTDFSSGINFVIGGMVWDRFIFGVWDGKITLQHRDGPGNNQILQYDYTFNNGTWYYISGTFDYNNNFQKLYINGSEVASTGVSYLPGYGIYYIGGGGHTDILDSYFNGSIDEVRIYNRALSSGEVRDLYNWAPGPVAHWKMDENVLGDAQTLNDVSGNGNTGTTVDGANNTGMDCMVQGKYGSACEFDGVDDYVSMGNGDILKFTSDMTMSAWINANDTSFAGLSIIRKWTNGYLMQLYNDRLYTYWALNNGDEYSVSTSYPYTYVNSWHFVATSITDNGDGTWTNRIYIDGIIVESRTETVSGPAALASQTSNLTVSLEANPFNGSIDDVRIYNYARTQAQILEDYSGGRKQKQPIGHWKFNEGYGTTANNLGIGGTALNGTLTNMASPATSTSGWTDSGKIGKGLNFDGSDDYVDAGNNDSINNLDTWTIEAWTKPNAGYGQVAPRLMNKGNGIRAYFSPASGKITVDTTDDNGAFQGVITSTNAIPINEWTHIIATLNEGASQKIRLYVNGKLDGTGSELTNPTTLTNDLYFGGADTRYFNGSIDDVKIYNYALTEDEVREEYNGGAFLKLGSTGTDSSGNPDDSQNREYCIPGDSSTCNPPVGRWDFSEGTGTTVNDISGNDNTGTWSGTGEHWDLGKVGFGGSFNGSDDYVDAGNNSSLQLVDSITMEVWVKIDEFPTTDNSTWKSILNKDIAFGIASNRQYAIGLYNSGGTQYLQIVLANDGTTSTSIALSSSTSGIDTTGVWYHIVGTWDGTTNTNGADAYINGILKGSATSTFTTGRDMGANFTIGRSALQNSGQYYPFTGQIDQVRIYDYARTPAQIAWDYNRGKPIAHWKFDECQGPTANDASGNGNNGTITIGATGTQDGIGTCTDGDSSNAWYNGRTGKYNSSMSFDGSDDYVEISDSDSIDMSGDMTIHAWIKPIATLQDEAVLVRKASNDCGNYNFQIKTHKLALLSANECSWTMAGANSTVVDGVWQHVSASINGTTLKYYINGVNTDTITGWNIGSVTSDVLSIGGYSGAPSGDRFNGSIDEVKIYNYALTAEQVKTEYNSGAVRFE